MAAGIGWWACTSAEVHAKQWLNILVMPMVLDSCQFIIQNHFLKAKKTEFHNGVKRLSFDRGFHSPENQTQLSELVNHLCLPKPGAKQSVTQLADANDEFLAAQQNHPGIEAAIGALQSGNAMKRQRDEAVPRPYGDRIRTLPATGDTRSQPAHARPTADRRSSAEKQSRAHSPRSGLSNAHKSHRVANGRRL